MEDKNSCSENSTPQSCFTESLIGSIGGLEVAVERCPLCSESKRPYYCKDCVEKGKFTLSSATYPDSYEQLHRKWEHKKGQRDHMLERFKAETRFIQKRDLQRSLIDECKKKIELLRKSICAKKELIEKDKGNREKIRRRNLEHHYKGKKHKQKKANITEYIHKVRDSIDKKKDQLTATENDLMVIRQGLIKDLSTYIFDVSEVKAKGGSLTSMGQSDEVQKQLQEASQTAYVGGRWIYTSNQFRIIVPTLPALGDYTQYNVLVAKKKEDGSSETASACSPTENVVTTVNAGLCYTSQLVSVLSNILNLSLPKRQSYSEFCVSEMPERMFNKAVARLNMNVLYLCFSQGVDPDMIEPKHTLHNIMLLLNHSQLGRLGAFDVIQDMMDSVIDSNGHSEESDEECFDSHANDELDAKEWETVPDNLPDAPCPQESTSMQSFGYTSQNMSDSQLTASGVLSTAMSSFSYFFRR